MHVKKILLASWVIILDIIGVLLLLLAMAVGWLPGPAGIPLTLAGLSLLAINHDWANRLLQRFKTEGLKVKDWFLAKISRNKRPPKH